MPTIPVYSIQVPEYTVDSPPDEDSIGYRLDEFIATRVPPGRVALRCISLADHPGKSVSDLVEIITRLGTDRYDPDHAGPYANSYRESGADLIALPCTITADRKLISSHCANSVMGDGIGDFYFGPPVDRGGQPLRIDLVMVYDLAQLCAVPDEYPDEEPCGYRFLDPERKPEALLAIITIGT